MVCPRGRTRRRLRCRHTSQRPLSRRPRGSHEARAEGSRQHHRVLRVPAWRSPRSRVRAPSPSDRRARPVSRCCGCTASTAVCPVAGSEAPGRQGCSARWRRSNGRRCARPAPRARRYIARGRSVVLSCGSGLSALAKGISDALARHRRRTNAAYAASACREAAAMSPESARDELPHSCTRPTTLSESCPDCARVSSTHWRASGKPTAEPEEECRGSR